MGISTRNSKKRDRQTGEKALDLPARSRFGEGRAQPLSHEIQTVRRATQKIFLKSGKSKSLTLTLIMEVTMKIKNKKCKECNKTKSIDKFYKNSKTKDGFSKK